MKNICYLPFFFLILLIPSINLQSQDLGKKEIGLQIYGLKSYGIVYKKEKSSDKYLSFTLSALSLNGNHDFTRIMSANIPSSVFSYEIHRFNTLFGLSMCLEKRKRITNELLFAHGFEPRLNMNFNDQVYNSEKKITTVYSILRLGYKLGFQYHVFENFYISLETSPSISGSVWINSERDLIDDILLTQSVSIRTRASFNLRATTLSLVYRFQKKNKKLN